MQVTRIGFIGTLFVAAVLSSSMACAEAAIDILKQVSLTGGAPFFDADNPGDPDVPVGAIGNDATYRLIVRNIGDEMLVNAVINDPTLGLVNVPVPGGPLNPGDERVIDAGDIGFGALFFPDRCDSTGNKNNIASVNADGQNTGTPVSDDDPANVSCVEENITIKKQVSLTGGAPFFDADNPGDADVPEGFLGADATYRLIVENVGTTVLINARITDPTLGLVNVPVPGGPLNPGDVRVINAGDIGFGALFFPDRCDSVGNKLNVARVDTAGQDTGAPVSNEDPANVSCVEENITILKQVSLTGGAPFFDADNPGDPDVPVGAIGNDATYRLIVRNIGDEMLVNAVINDPTLGLVNVPVPGGPLNPGDERVIDAGDIGFGALFFPDRCDSTGNKNNIASVNADGQNTGTPVSDDDPANVSCVEENITIKKQVSLTGGAPFFDADNPGDADVPEGFLGADATYRLIVENVGTTVLINARITDPTLGLVNVPVPGGPLNPGDVRVINAGDIGFGALFFPDRCDSVGNKLNVARVDTAGQDTGAPVSNEDPANVICVQSNAPPVAQCMDATVSTDAGVCSAAVASIDDGSFDPDGGNITLQQIPTGPYGLGMTQVTLTVTDEAGATDSCEGKVTIVDNEPPGIVCNAPDTIIPTDVPISFTASATDNCLAETGTTTVITGFDCFKFTKKGKRIDKTNSCEVSFTGDTITIVDSGGAGDQITWIVTVTDGNGNQAVEVCEVLVVNPGNKP